MLQRSKPDSKQNNTTHIGSNLSFEQRKEMMELMKRMLPPVPSRGIIDIRFSFWFFKRWYIVFIFGEDIRDTFKANDRGEMDEGLIRIAKIFTYFILTVLMILIVLLVLYLLKSIAGIDIFPDQHLTDILHLT